MINIKGKIFIIATLFMFVFAGTVALAATNDIIFSEDITATNITFGSGTTDMIVFASSSAETFDITSGIFTVTNPGSAFKVGSSNSSVRTIVILNGSTMESCTVNTTPGTSSATLPTASGTYTIRPLEASDCDSLCDSITGALTYNAYPTCGAASCDSGYSLSGSGSSAICQIQSSGGGSGSYIPPTTTSNEGETTVQSFITTDDGTEVTSETTTTVADGYVVKVEVEAKIKTVMDATDMQVITLNSSAIADVKEVKVGLSKESIAELAGESINKNITVNISSQGAISTQKSTAALGGKFLIGLDVFSIDIKVGDSVIENFSNPINLSFDVSNLENKEKLKVYYFNAATNEWEIAGDGGTIVDDQLVVEIDHLTDFGILKEGGVVEKEVDVNVLTAREKQILQIEDDAGVVFISGTDLNIILIHNNVEKDVEKQIYGMNNYIPQLKEGIEGLTINNIYAVNNFIMYGTITTRILGAGERAGVVNSYKKAFNKLPITAEEWKDCIAIGNGRWPGETSTSAESKAQQEFMTIYLRDANMENPNDNAAVTVIAYGLRPSDRNMESEKAGILIFKGIYGYNPSSALDWDIVRAISYSGATR